MKPTTYTDARIWSIFRELHRRGLAMTMGINRRTGAPMVWLTTKTGLDRAPVTIGTAERVLAAALEAERTRREVLIGEVVEMAGGGRAHVAYLRIAPPRVTG